MAGRPAKARPSGELREERELRRKRASIALGMLERYYDAASSGRRTEGWRRVSGDGNAATDRGLSIRETARDLVRNNALATAIVNTIVDDVVGWGIEPKLPPGQFGTAWKEWADTPRCDAERRRTLHGLGRQALWTVVTAGECLVRRRIRRPEDGLAIPMQLQLLEPDFLDETLDRNLPNGGEIVQGVEFSPIGEPVAYWLFPEHPGANRVGSVRGDASIRVQASEIRHLALPERPGQTRAVSWLAPILLMLKDSDDYKDAALMKQKIAACLAVILTDATGAGTPIGQADDTVTPGIDHLQPGLIARFAAGDTVQVVQPPSVSEHAAYMKTIHQEIATGMGIGYEDMTGDYSQVNFSSARMAKIRAWKRVHAWRYDLMIPQFYRGVWDWAVELAPLGPYAARAVVPKGYVVTWTPPPMPMLDPAAEGLAYRNNIRAGLISLSEAHRELGYDSKDVVKEMTADYAALDAAGLILDSDPRQTTQAGQLQGEALPKEEPAPEPPDPGESEASRAIRRVEEKVALAFRGLEQSLAEQAAVLAAHDGRNGHVYVPPSVTVHNTTPPANIHVAGPEFHQGAFQTDTVVQMPEGMIQVAVAPSPTPDVTINCPPQAAAPPADVRVVVEAPPAPPPAEVVVNIAPPPAPPPAEVVVNIAPPPVPPPAEVRIDAPVTVQPAQIVVEGAQIHLPAPPEPKAMRRIVESRDADGNIESMREEPIDDAPSV